MRIQEFFWNVDNIHHIARHGIAPPEVEEACYLRSVVLKGRQNRYYILGRTEAGRYLFVVLAYHGEGRVRVITARDMTPAERKRFGKK